jgi:hypothetical protein
MRNPIGEEGNSTCSECKEERPNWALYVPISGEPFSGNVCGNCINENINISTPVVQVTPTWETEKGKYLKAQRDSILNDCAWVFLPDCPYTDATVTLIAAYRKLLHRMTVDYTADTWQWPEYPTITYKAT